MTEQIGYDIGGSEYPEGSRYMVIDIVSPDEASSTETVDGSPVSDLKFKRADLRKPGWSKGLKPRPEILVGAVLRYLNEDGQWPDEVGGHLTGQQVNTERFVRIGKDIRRIWSYKPGSKITIRDHMALIEPLLLGLLEGTDDRVRISMEWLDGPDEDLPATWNVTVTVK